jgi:hypothetical protein
MEVELIEVDALPAHDDLEHAMEFAKGECCWRQNAPPHHGTDPVSQTLTCRMALASSAAGIEDFSSKPGDLGRRFIQAD